METSCKVIPSRCGYAPHLDCARRKRLRDLAHVCCEGLAQLGHVRLALALHQHLLPVRRATVRVSGGVQGIQGWALWGFRNPTQAYLNAVHRNQ